MLRSHSDSLYTAVCCPREERERKSLLLSENSRTCGTPTDSMGGVSGTIWTGEEEKVIMRTWRLKGLWRSPSCPLGLHTHTIETEDIKKCLKLVCPRGGQWLYNSVILCSHYTTEPCQNWARLVYKASVNTTEPC